MSEVNDPKFDIAPLLETIENRIIEEEVKYIGDNMSLGVEIEDPVKQSRDDDSARTCLVATAINTLKAFGINPPTEEELIQEISSSDSFDENGELGLPPILDYLRKQNLKTNNESIWGYPDKIVQGISEGGVIIFGVPSKGGNKRSHAKLLSGVEIDDGNIMIREYDPNPMEPDSKLVPIREIMDELCNTDSNTSMNLISRHQYNVPD